MQFAQTLEKGKGRIHGVDASEAMIAAAKKAAASDSAAEKVCSFESKLDPISELKKSTDNGNISRCNGITARTPGREFW